MTEFMRVEDLTVYQKLCGLPVDVSARTKRWPREERFELSAQVHRPSNSSPTNLAEKHSERHVRNKIEGVNRARCEALETVHHLYIARLKGYLSEEEYELLGERYRECVRMLNGLEKALEQQLPESLRRWRHKDEAREHPEL